MHVDCTESRASQIRPFIKNFKQEAVHLADKSDKSMRNVCLVNEYQIKAFTGCESCCQAIQCVSRLTAKLTANTIDTMRKNVISIDIT